jgi:hypothetical protein
MLNYENYPFIYRNGWKVYLIHWGHTEKEFQAVWKGWNKEHCLKNFDNPATIEFLPNPNWAQVSQE